MSQTITTIIQVIDKGTGKLRDFQKTVDTISGSTRTLTTYVKQNDEWIKKQEKTMEGLPRRFQMQYLSVMFFGMQIQRIFQRMATSATQTYLKMTEGQTQAGQALLGLSAGFAFLSFTVGEAIGRFLEPFIPIILEIVTLISDWVSQHEDLVAAFIIGAAAIGGFMFAMSAIKLGVTGTITAIKDIEMAFAGLSIVGGPIGLAIAAVIAFMALFAVAEWDKLQKVVSDFGKAFSEDAKGNTEQANKWYRLSIDELSLAFEEFFTVKLPIMIWAGLQVGLNLLNIFVQRAVYSLAYVGLRMEGVSDESARLLANMVVAKIPDVISIPRPDVSGAVKSIAQQQGNIDVMRRYLTGGPTQVSVNGVNITINSSTEKPLTEDDIKRMISQSFEDVIWRAQQKAK